MVGVRRVVNTWLAYDPEKAVLDLRSNSLNPANSVGLVGFKRSADELHGSDIDLVVSDAQCLDHTVHEHFAIEVHGKKLKLCNDPLFLFRADQYIPNQIRKMAVWLTEWYWFEALITAAIFINCIIMALPSSYSPGRATPEEESIFFAVNLACVILFSAECVLKIIARGLLISNAPDPCYFQSITNWFDLFILATSIMELTIVTKGTSSKLILLRTFRILRPLRTIEHLPILKMIVSTLTDSIPRLIHWLLTSIFMASIFAILGTSLFGTTYWHRCRLTPSPIVNDAGHLEWPIDHAQTRFCGGRYSCQPTASGNLTYCGSVVTNFDGTIPGIDPWPELHNEAIADFGYSGFQTFLAALSTIFQVATMEGWSEIMYRYQDGRSDILALVYFISLLLFGGLLLLKLVIAILWQSFESKMRHNLVIKEDDIPAHIMDMKIDELATQVHDQEANLKAKNLYKQMDASAGAFSTVRSICLSVVNTPTFDGVILVVIAVNCGVLACDAYPEPDKIVIKLTEQVNVFCGIIFTIEACLRMISEGIRYFSEYFNLFDLALVVVSLVELAIGGSATVSALRVSRLLRLFKIFGQSVPMRVLYRVLRRATVLSCNFCIIVILVMMGWSLVALHLFYEDWKADPVKGRTQIEFSNFLWAFIAIFQLLCGDRWHETMVEHAHASKNHALTVVFFVAVLISCHLIIMNLFLGMFVAAFSVAREEVINEYRRRMLEFAAPKTGEQPSKPAPPPPPPKVEPPEPTWPHGSVKIRRDTMKSCTNDMHVLKMIRIKQKSAIRAERNGDASFMREVSDDWKPGNSISVAPPIAAPIQPRSSERRSVSFADLEIRVPEDTEVATVSSAKLMNLPEHQAMPPPMPELEMAKSQSTSNDPVLPRHSTSGTGQGELILPPVLCRESSVHTWSQPCHRIGGSENQLIALPRFAAQGRSVTPRYTSILAAGRAGMDRIVHNDITAHSEINHEITSHCNTGLRCRRQVEARTFSSHHVEARKHPAPDFLEAYRRARFRAGVENVQATSYSSKLQMQLKSEPRYIHSDFKGYQAESLESKQAACRQFEVQASANSWKGRFSPTPPCTHSMNKLNFGSDDDAGANIWQEVCLPVRDHSRESFGHDQELVPRRGHLLLSMESHSAPPVDVVDEKVDDVDKYGPITVLFQKVVRQSWFDPTILALIGVSSICLAIETPYMQKDSNLGMVLEVIDYIVSTAFICEMILKIGAFGIWTTKSPAGEAYLRSGWNWLDGIVVLSSLLDYGSRLFTSSNTLFKIIRAIRLMRALRPLRLVQRNKGIKVLVESLIKSMPTLFRTLVVTALLYVGFAILFMNLLKGQLWRCSLDPTGDLRPDIVTRGDCEVAGGVWINARSHFDQIGNSFAAVVHVGTGEGWVEVLQDMVNSVGIDRQPRKNARVEYAFLMVGFVALSNFFLVNLFVGVLIDQYCVIRDIMNGLELSDQAEKQFAAVQRQIFSMTDLLRPTFVIRGSMIQSRTLVARVTQSRAFEAFMYFCILANSLLLCLVHPTMSSNQRQAIDMGSTVFIIIFNLEACLKGFVYRADYFKDAWNVFDLVMVVGADSSLLVQHLSSEGTMVEVLHAFRVVRVLRLVRIFVFLRRQCTALLTLVPATLNVGLLLVLLLFMYACLGVGLFGTIAPGETLNDAANFKSFGMAFLTAIRIMTGEKWHDLMYDLVSDRPNCTTELQSPTELELEGPRGCGTALAYPYFVSFTSFVSIIMLNLVVAVVLDGYQSVELSTNFECYTQQVKHLASVWREHDKASTGYLRLEKALRVLTVVPVPIGFEGTRPHRVRHMLRELPLYEERVHFRDVITVSVKRVYCWLNHWREQDATNVKLNPDALAQWYSFFPGIPHPDMSLKSFFVAHAIIRHRLEDHIRRSRRRRMLKAREEVLKEDENMQLQAKSKGAKAAAMLLNQDPTTGQRLGGLNAAGLPLQMPGGDLQGASCEERAPVSVEALTAGLAMSQGTSLRPSSAALAWPPPMPIRQGRQSEGEKPQFRSCALVGSGFGSV